MPDKTAPPVFGRARRPRPELLNNSEVIIITAQQLPLLGIQYGMGHLRRMWQTGAFPKPIRLSPNRIGWRMSAIEKWIADREAETAKEARDTTQHRKAGKASARARQKQNAK